MRHLAFEKFMGGTAIGAIILLSATSRARAATSPTKPLKIIQQLTEPVDHQIKLCDNQGDAILFTSVSFGPNIEATMVKTDVVMNIGIPALGTTITQAN